MHQLFKVVTKAALFNGDKSKVLVIHMDHNNEYGLPGGHIEKNETMNEALERELLEECGVTTRSIKRADFFTHSNGKIVLAYVGTLDHDDVHSQQDNREGIPKWLTRQEFEKINIDPGYRKLVLDNWP